MTIIDCRGLQEHRGELLAQMPGLNPDNWGVVELTLAQQEPAGLPLLDATLAAQSGRALRQCRDVTGLVFYAFGYVWWVASTQVSVDALGGASISLSCRAIWKQPAEVEPGGPAALPASGEGEA